LLSVLGTSFIPHFGQLPGWSITTSGCITQVYFCDGEAERDGTGFAIAFIVAQVIAIAIRIKICFCMLILKLVRFVRAGIAAATLPDE